MASAAVDDISVTEDDGLVTVALDRPDKRNALTPTMLEALHGVFTEFASDPPAGVLVTGRGPVTCAGMDTEIVSQDYEADFADVDALAQELYALVADLPCPVAVAARGGLIGMGFVISLSADFLVIGEETTLSVPEVQFDIVSERTVDQLPEIVGRRVAAELLLTGEPIAPERAFETGLANRVVQSDEVDEAARELLAIVAEHDRETVGEIRSLIRGGSPDGR